MLKYILFHYLGTGGFQKMADVSVDSGLCTGCASCVGICPAGVFEIASKKGKSIAVVCKASECLECHACEAQCPVNAIKVE